MYYAFSRLINEIFYIHRSIRTKYIKIYRVKANKAFISDLLQLRSKVS